jgi:sterol desaturase/sphingolipid hydroxylase (fatty acid hydroxylase superfamily)
MSFVLSVAALTVVYCVVAALERTRALRFRILPMPRPYLSTDLAWYGLAILATAMSVFILRPQLSKLEFGPLQAGVASLPVVAQFVMALIVFDFVSFAVHVGLHRSNALWNFHKVHHSTLHLDGLATTRTHMFENLLRFVPGQAVLFLIGMPVAVVAPTVAIAAIYGVSNHSNLAINAPWVEGVFVTPRLHRRHHVPSTTQHNFGAIFTFWDRCFGTLIRVETAPQERYGVPGEIDSYPQRFRVAFRQPFVQLRSERRSSTRAKSDRALIEAVDRRDI